MRGGVHRSSDRRLSRRPGVRPRTRPGGGRRPTAQASVRRPPSRFTDVHRRYCQLVVSETKDPAAERAAIRRSSLHRSQDRRSDLLHSRFLLGPGLLLLSEPGTLSWIMGPIDPVSADGTHAASSGAAWSRSPGETAGIGCTFMRFSVSKCLPNAGCAKRALRRAGACAARRKLPVDDYSRHGANAEALRTPRDLVVPHVEDRHVAGVTRNSPHERNRLLTHSAPCTEHLYLPSVRHRSFLPDGIFCT